MKKRLFRILCIVLCIAVISGIIATVSYTKRNPVIIGIIDTGISSKAIPADHILEGKNYIDPTKSTEDTYGHGTAVASVILKHLPQAQFVPLVSNAYNKGKIEQVDNDVFAQMIRDAVDVYHCQIINLSVGLILDKQSIREAVVYAEEKGVLVVASAGNDYATDGEFTYYPAAYDTVFAVGSVNKEGTSISDFSQRGDWVDLYACGEEIEIKTLSGNTRESEGTSYSAALVTARAGQFLQKNINLTPANLREKLLEKCKTNSSIKILP
ncbi:MAG: S8/S53 family peptidase [Clostridia bacterium]|nr:S8/S53 family peptidase [Clostridia bacterium]